MLCFVFPRGESAIAICSRRAPIARRLTSTFKISVLVHFLALPNFFLPLSKTLSVYSTHPNPCGKAMLGGRFAVPGKRKTKGREWRVPTARG